MLQSDNDDRLQDTSRQLEDRRFQAIPRHPIGASISAIAIIGWVLRAISIVNDWREKRKKGEALLASLAELVEKISKSTAVAVVLYSTVVIVENVPNVTTISGLKKLEREVELIRGVLGTLEGDAEGKQDTASSQAADDEGDFESEGEATNQEDDTIQRRLMAVDAKVASLAEELDLLRNSLPSQIREALISPYGSNPKLRSSLSEPDTSLTPRRGS